MRTRRGFGSIDRLASGNYRARYSGPDLGRHSAPFTFDTRGDAESWLSKERRLIQTEEWTPPGHRARLRATSLTFGQYAETWWLERPVKPSTRAQYRGVLTRDLLPTFGDRALLDVTADSVRTWYAKYGDGRPTSRAQAYSLLRTIFGTAVQDGLVPMNPCHIRGAGNVQRVHRVRPATLQELEVMTGALPPRYRLMLLLAAWCAMRFGELTELRRKDIDLVDGVVKIRRAVVRVEGRYLVSTPKTAAGTRDVAIPPHLLPIVQQHLKMHAVPGGESLLFPSRHGDHMAPATLYKVWYPARQAAGRPDLRWHDLRHTGAVLAAQTGATLAELMGRLGHTTPAAALRYQHVAQGRDTEIASVDDA